MDHDSDFEKPESDDDVITFLPPTRRLDYSFQGIQLTYTQYDEPPRTTIEKLQKLPSWADVLYFTASREPHKTSGFHSHVFLMMKKPLRQGTGPRAPFTYSQNDFTLAHPQKPGKFRIPQIVNKPFRKGRRYVRKNKKLDAFEQPPVLYYMYLTHKMLFHPLELLSAQVYDPATMLTYSSLIKTQPWRPLIGSVSIDWTFARSIDKIPFIPPTPEYFVKDFSSSPYWDGYHRQPHVFLLISAPLAEAQTRQLSLLMTPFRLQLPLPLKGGYILPHWSSLHVVFFFQPSMSDILMMDNAKFGRLN